MTSLTEGFASRLADPSIDLMSKGNIAVELRDSVEAHTVSADEELFVSQLLPEIMRLLSSVPVSMHARSPENKLRHGLLDVLSRLQLNDSLKVASKDIMTAIMQLLETDNEENGVLAVKIYSNFQRAYKAHLVEFVQPFFDFVLQLGGSMPSLVEELFSLQQTTQPQQPQHQGEVQLFKAVNSFKVLTECPIVIVLLYSTHRHLIAQSLPVFIPPIIDILSLEAPPQEREHAAAAAKGEFFCGVAPAIWNGPHRAAYGDFVTAQIKVMSFLTYAIRAFPGALQQHYNLVPNFVMRLLKDCPAELSSARKELLVSMRHILNTDLRTFFISKVDILLEDKVLLGTGLTAHESLRPLAYSTMADLIHHVRNELSTAQIWKTVAVFGRNLHDLSIATSFQIMSAKLLLNFLDRIAQGGELTEGRAIMTSILETFVYRVVLLNHQHAPQASVIKVHPDPAPGSQARDAAYMLKNMVHFLKNLTFGLKATNPPQPLAGPLTEPSLTGSNAGPQWGDVARGLGFEDFALYRLLLREGLKSMNLLKDSPVDEKDAMDTFVACFYYLDPSAFNEIIKLELDTLVDLIVENPAVLHFTHLLALHEYTTVNFCGTLLRYLINKLPEIGDSGDRPSVYGKLLKQVYSAINMYPATNESLIVPHLRVLIVDSFELAPNSENPMRYYSLVQHLFRSLGGGRFDVVYKAIMPLLPWLLETLNRRLEFARNKDEKSIFATLCLIVPVRLSLLVPHLSYLVKPLVQALHGSPEAVFQALRTLEMCVDNLTGQYFDPIVEPVLPELMAALWSHLKPQPYDSKISHQVVRILGKLGGRNRSWIGPPTDLRATDTDTRTLLQFKGLDKNVPLRLDPVIRAAKSVLHDSHSQSHYKKAAFEALSVIFLRFITSDMEGVSPNSLREVSKVTEFRDCPPLPDGSRGNLASRQESNSIAEELLQLIFYSYSIPELRSQAHDLVINITEHLVICELGEIGIERRQLVRPFNLDDHDGILYCTPRSLLSTILYALSHSDQVVRDSGRDAIQAIFDTGKIICEPGTDVYRYPMMRALYSKLVHCCFEEPTYTKAGAVRGLQILIIELGLTNPRSWLVARLAELSRTLFFVIKDSAPDSPKQLQKDATDLLLLLLQHYVEDWDPSQFNQRPFSMLTSLLAFELESASSACREAARQSLRLLSESTGTSLNEILSRVTDFFLNPIFMKPLRALPFPIQIGYIDAICFCLSIPDTFLVFNEKLTRLLEEALALVDAEDESLTSAHRAFEYSVANQLADLRVVSIRLLALAVNSSDYLGTHQPQTKNKILAVFFKMLGSSTPKVVDAAHEALREALPHTPKLPRELLQSCLRPVLVNMSDYKRLNAPCLETLAHLMELMTAYFKVEIGRKLLDHLRAWTDPTRMMQISSGVLEGDEPIDVAVAILNVFKFLPDAAITFIPELIESLLSIESSLRRQQESPFRAPVARFLDRHPEHAFNFFAERLASPVIGRLFASMLGEKDCKHFREYAHQNANELCSRILQVEGEDEQCVGICNIIYVIDVLGSADHEWLQSQSNILENLVSSIGDMILAADALPPVSPLHFIVSAALLKLQNVVVQSNPGWGLMRQLVVALGAVNTRYSPILADYISQTYVKASTDNKAVILEQIFTLLTDESCNLPVREWLMHTAVLPMVQAEVSDNGTLEDLAGHKNWIELLNKKVWLVPPPLTPSIDAYQFSLLEVTLLLVRYAPHAISDVRKIIIKFAWSFLRFEDVVSKQAAHVLIAYFISQFESLPKMVSILYNALLKTSQTDAKPLVAEALDALSTLFVNKPQTDTHMWIRIPRRVLGEDGHGIVPVSNVCQFIAKHPKLFYPHRESFVPYIVATMAKLSYLPNASLDVDLAELMATWEAQRHEEGTGFEMSYLERDKVVTCLVRLLVSQNRGTSDERVVKALDKLLTLWTDVEVKLIFFERPLTQSDFSQQQAQFQAINALQVVKLAIEHRPEDWVRMHTEALLQLIEKVLKCSYYEVHQALAPVIHRLLEVGDEDIVLPVVTNAAADHLSQNPTPPCWVRLVAEVARVRLGSNDPLLPLMPGIIKALTRSQAPPALSTDLLIEGLDIVSARISHLGDQRRGFLTLLAQLVDRKTDRVLGLHIVQMVRQWVFSQVEIFPTVKEKAAILHKLVTYRDPEVQRVYFELIIDIFSDMHLRSTELPARLEQPFLVGCCREDVEIRRKLLSILASTVEKTAQKRLEYIIADQNWESVGDRQWLVVALQLLTDVQDFEKPLNVALDYTYPPPSIITRCLPSTNEGKSQDVEELLDADDPLAEIVARRREWLANIDKIESARLVGPLRELFYSDNYLVHDSWADLFSGIYPQLSPKEGNELLHALVGLMAKEYHMRQQIIPNSIQTLLEGVSRCEYLPPMLVKYLGENYNAWFPAIRTLENIQAKPKSDSPKVAECNLDALAEIYAALEEVDMFYGVWRTRTNISFTSSALSFEQCGMWTRAMTMHETAQIRARQGNVAFSESEYALWEDHWILCAEKLQHWDVLSDLAKHEGFNDLLVECGWRQADWIAEKEGLEQSIKSLMDVPTPRRQVFETFLVLQGFAQKAESQQRVFHSCEEGMQLALMKWVHLPSRPTPAQIPLLHAFQQYVEFIEASQVYTSLATTTAQNLESKSNELKTVMCAWHTRLPNIWDDINLWGDLVTWRQHVFGVINRVYLPLIPQIQGQAPNGQNNSAVYRGYHEIAWTINRFAHVARKHNLPEVCVQLLSKIYTLPNIEIQEAFLKLREQAKCHYQSQNDVATGLEIISNTNLVFFGNAQKSEFFALKGMSLARLGAEEHANEAFSTAVSIDVYLPKAWAEWGLFNDKRFKDHPDQIAYGSTAVACYLQAAGLYKNAKCRKLLGRILWLLSLDDAQGSISMAYDNYKGDTPVWYWVAYVPQLLGTLSQREGRLTVGILTKIAKMYPQTLHFHLRTAREEHAILQKMAARRQAVQNVGTPVGQAVGANSSSGSVGITPSGSPRPGPSPGTGEGNLVGEYMDEVTNTLKTAYPLLMLSLETLIDQMYHRFKSPPDEDAYRLTVALLNDGLSYLGRQQYPREDLKLPPQTEANVSKFSESVMPASIRPAFEADFVHSRPNLQTYIKRLCKWRDRLETKLDSRPSRVNLEAMSPPLSEFHHQKFEDVEVPGQNQELKDSNAHFVKIDRFLPHVDLVRSFGICYRRITIQGQDGNLYPFAVQYPAARHCRREERMTQVFKFLNEVLRRRTECRTRQLQFTLPSAVPLNTHIRLVQDDSRYVSFYQIYERYCKQKGQSRDAPIDYTVEKMRAAFEPTPAKPPDMTAVKMEILSGIEAELVPPTIMRDFFTYQYKNFEDFWRFRKQFSYQYAGVTLMTIMMSINNRYPHKFLVNLASGNVWATEMLPILPPSKNPPSFLNGEPVAFRFTPNIQTLMGPTCAEGIFAMCIMIIAKGLTEPEFDLAQFLPVFVRDELISLYLQQQRPAPQESQMRDIVRLNVDAIVRRASSLAQIGTGNIPANQTVIDLISLAVNPHNLALTDSLWMPYY